MTEKDIASNGTILRCVVGSQLYGVNLESGGDRDEMGICIEPPEYVIGLKEFEQWVYRSQPEGTRSGDGDLDLVIYGLRKWTRLALKGNPTALQLLFVPNELTTVRTDVAARLQDLSWAFASRYAGKAFLGYMTAQRQRLMGERGQMRVKRPELVEKHGYDTKYAAHIVRLGYQGVEFLTTGKLTLPMPEKERVIVTGIRKGTLDFDDVLNISGKLAHMIEDLLDESPLAEYPDYEAVNDFLFKSYINHWGENGS